MNEIDQIYFHNFADIQGQEFDFIVIGGGAYGTGFVHKVLQYQPRARIAVLEKGSYLIPDHIQNLPASFIKLNTSTGIRPWEYKGTPNLNFMPQIPYVGGRALFWNAWTPQPDSSEMPDWPAAAIERLNNEWYPTGEYMGRRYSLKTPGNRNEKLHEFMGQRLFSRLSRIEGATPQSNPAALDSAMATGQGVPQEAWAKFAPIPVLVQAAQLHPDNLKVVVNAEVEKLIAHNGQVTEIQTRDGNLKVGNAKLILACNTLEAGFILTRSFPQDPLPGNNLCGHIRSWLAARIPASAIPALTDGLQAVAFYLPGKDAATGRLMHTHISVVHNPTPAASAEVLYRILPDASTPEAVATYQDPNYVVIMLHSMGEFLGERAPGSWNRVGTSASGVSEVFIEMQPEDEAFWQAMDRTTFDVMQALAGNADIEYQHNHSDGSFSWEKTKPASIRNQGLVHEAGTLWMGDNPTTSVCRANGQLHKYPNVFGLGSMLFPRPGSWNPTLTGMAQAFALARELCT
ncbi:GMC family oxidoreductase [Shewanella cyperi]|uniref:GMC family oxidoreductase n=1 Tax=Shewanella cyperi TaxID=2814292 RepID=A0A975AJS5_9GAMM|nr:GMC oxidoreductase [Shewanella cyperi]QSX29400.1 GMC family oxidoreductase [Shewanella cyperi]